MRSILVGNLDFSATEDSVRELFDAFGLVDRVDVLRDSGTGAPCGFAFVEMPEDEAADRAIAGLNGATVGSRAIAVDDARPRIVNDPDRTPKGRGPHIGREPRRQS
jgi:RNA recognition motif-containing protein